MAVLILNLGTTWGWSPSCNCFISKERTPVTLWIRG